MSIRPAFIALILATLSTSALAGTTSPATPTTTTKAATTSTASASSSSSSASSTAPKEPKVYTHDVSGVVKSIDSSGNSVIITITGKDGSKDFAIDTKDVTLPSDVKVGSKIKVSYIDHAARTLAIAKS